MKKFLLYFLLFFFGACNVPPEPFTQKRLVVARNETIRLPEINVSITNKGCGREWGDEDRAERAFCEVEIKSKDSTVFLMNGSKPVFIGVLKIEMDRMNPWGLEEDSIPPGGCRVIVTKLPDNSR